jgi:CRP/FNR family transcriptional regulator
MDERKEVAMKDDRETVEDDSKAQPAAAERAVARGRTIYMAGETGVAWRVVSGTVRFDQPGADGVQFAGLALAGDVIGAETLLFGRYTFNALALSACVIEPWLAGQGAPSGETLLGMLAGAERRMAEVLALRSGKAGERIRRLLAFMSTRLASGRRAARLALPRLKDIADITDLSVETVSRTITHLGADGSLEVFGRYRSREVGTGPACNSYPRK